MEIKTKHVSTKATTTNPKDILGSAKVSISSVPAVAILHEACAMMTGGDKYGQYNWRANPVVARIYIDAALRHIYAWLEGEEVAIDSGVHHLGHARACLGILLDAQETGNLVDDRPFVDQDLYPQVIEALNEWVSGGPSESESTSNTEPVESNFVKFYNDTQQDLMGKFRQYIEEASERDALYQNNPTADFSPGSGG